MTTAPHDPTHFLFDSLLPYHYLSFASLYRRLFLFTSERGRDVLISRPLLVAMRFYYPAAGNNRNVIDFIRSFTSFEQSSVMKLCHDSAIPNYIKEKEKKGVVSTTATNMWRGKSAIIEIIFIKISI